MPQKRQAWRNGRGDMGGSARGSRGRGGELSGIIGGFLLVFVDERAAVGSVVGDDFAEESGFDVWVSA